MSVIAKALKQLDRSITRLESGIHKMEHSLAGQQRDMFGAIIPPAVKTPASGNGFSSDNAVIAQRLDKAIRKVEELLES